MQAEQRTAIPYQIKLDIAATAIQLKLALVVAPRQCFTSFHDRQIGLQEAFTYRLGKREAAFEIRGIQIVKEQAADTAGFVTVFDKEIVIAPLLYFGYTSSPKGAQS